MKDLAFHITDIVSNAIRAKASCISLSIDEQRGVITIRIADNGCGMDAATLSHAVDPFYTTRTTRRVGLGLPFLIQNAEQTGGNVGITSEPGRGTEVTARFLSTHIDCPPWGDLAGTVAMLITGNPEVNLCFSYHSEKADFSVSTADIKDILEGIPLSHPKVMLLVKEMVGENMK